MGNNKKKKPIKNPARGFATTSIASKPRADATPDATPDASSPKPAAGSDAPGSNKPDDTKASGRARSGPAGPGTSKPDAGSGTGAATAPTATMATAEMTPEEFAAHLEEAELQALVDQNAEKVRRDAKRQQQRLETDRRLLRGQAEPINSQKWLPADMIGRVMDLIQAEKRFGSGANGSAAGHAAAAGSAASKAVHEDNMAVRLWTLEQALAGMGFSDERVQQAVAAVLEASPDPGAIAKDSIWGLEEALEWFARECSVEELPSYDGRGREKKTQDSHSLPASGPATPRQRSPHTKKIQLEPKKNKAPVLKKKALPTYDLSDIEPEDLAPQYIDTKTRIFRLERSAPQAAAPQKKGGKKQALVLSEADAAALDRLKAKLHKIESDILFDKFAKIEADRQWQDHKPVLEKEIAAARQAEAKARAEKERAEKERAEEGQAETENAMAGEEPETEADKLARDAERMAAELLAENGSDDDGLELGDLFGNLPRLETDSSGKAATVTTGKDGQTITIRNFGEPSGLNPMRILESTCRARDQSVNKDKIRMVLISETPFAVRHLVAISWSKPQEITAESAIAEIGVYHSPELTEFSMTTIAAPNKAQSEAFVALAALFYMSVTAPKEHKTIYNQLSPQWKEVWDEWAAKRKERLDAQDREAIRRLREMVRQKNNRDLEDGVILQKAFRGRAAARKQGDGDTGGAERGPISAADSAAIRKQWQDKASTAKFQAMVAFRSQLPMWQFKQQVLEAVDNNPIVILCGETGCGKSTQVPAFLLEHQMSQGNRCKIYCTEPRRISAVSLARRVSEELGENRGDIGTHRSLVGYSIRLESNTTKETKLVYATTGIVMRMLESSNDLSEVTHLVLDEVHERTIDSDFLLIVLKRLMKRRPDLKVVLMSATVDSEKFSNYLDGAPVLKVPGRTFPVETKFIEDAIELTGWTTGEEEQIVEIDDDPPEPDNDGTASSGTTSSNKPDLASYLMGYSAATKTAVANLDDKRIQFDLIVQLISRIATHEQYAPFSKAILVFLPGMAEIRTLNDMLLGDPSFRDWLVYPLHSSIATEDQEMAFVVPPEGKRKIVLATNIAETGITIPDITCVIDTGKHKEMRFIEKRQMSQLLDTFISRANAKQRRGRAGRVQHGLCFHMFTRFRFENWMANDQQPEMLRLSLQDLAMRIKICKLGGIEETLNEALDPPSAKNIKKAVDSLVDVRALTASEDLTPLGVQLARLPLDVFLGKLLLVGTVFKCLDMALTVAAVMSSKSPFQASFGQRAQANNARMSFRRADSDLLTIYNAYCAWRKTCLTMGKDFQFCRKNYLNQQALANIEDLKGQLVVSLIDAGVLALTDDERRALDRVRFHSHRGRRSGPVFFELPQRVNSNSDVDAVTTSVIAWAFYPKLLVREAPGARAFRNIGNNQAISLHPTSVNRGRLTDAKWLSYYHILESKRVFHAHETTAVDPFAIALVCGEVRCDLFSGVLVLDGNRARFSLNDWKAALAIKTLRARLRDILTRSFKNPGALPSAQQQKWLDVWQRIFEQDFEDKNSGSSSSSAAAAAVAAGGHKN
ncbi:hypothetical protein TD95_004371 [Thielaviopsis punctulata]|uniref:RNA helicase n=1 Tax=Thielaviopsis punctulata TaxID=72032 RepID=A0A0F4ZIH4_9PEZI|nr:hypothetical protein TD95_004371 [Thielaviopsis punctulata]